jgi:hypothetical protein
MNLSTSGRFLFLVMMGRFHSGELPPQSRGFRIIENVINHQFVHAMKLFVRMAGDKKYWESILDHTGKDLPKYPRRKQISVKKVCGNVYPLFLKDIKIILKWLFPLHQVWDEHLIISEKDLGVQALHTDDQYSFTKILKNNEIMSYSAVIALYHEVEIRYSPTINGPEAKHQIITIPPCGMMIFCGNTVHSGMDWKEKTNWAPRIHFYIDPPGRTHDPLSQSFITPESLETLKKLSKEDKIQVGYEEI